MSTWSWNDVSGAVWFILSALVTWFVTRLYYSMQIVKIKGGDEVRLDNAKAHLIRVVTRRVSIEGYSLSDNEWARIRKGIAIIHRVEVTKLPTKEQIQDIIFTAAFESDHMTKAQVEAVSLRLRSRKDAWRLAAESDGSEDHETKSPKPWE